MSQNDQQLVDVLAFGAHPDDVELGCGGTLHALSSQNAKIGIVDLTEGEMGTRGTVDERRKEADAAAGILNAKFRINLQIPDTKIDNSASNRRKIISVIRKYRPNIVFAPHPGDRHPDHAHAANIVKEAAFYAGVRKIDADLELAPHRPHSLLYYMISTDFEPTFYVDISAGFDAKMDAIRAHKSQFYNPDYPGETTFIASKEYFESIETRAKYFGWKTGVRFAEPFWSASPILLTNLIDQLR
ncbi:MAG: bacillithiol biosynthesis deacetylase BshB1 [Calditrichia bacterium]|nr:bacillithiol biosynthesis deacetylase BshB1 [Calditrichia bacterium]